MRICITDAVTKPTIDKKKTKAYIDLLSLSIVWSMVDPGQKTWPIDVRIGAIMKLSDLGMSGNICGLVGKNAINPPLKTAQNVQKKLGRLESDIFSVEAIKTVQI